MKRGLVSALVLAHVSALDLALALASALFVVGAGVSAASAQAAPQCAAFTTLSAEARKRAAAVHTAMEAKVDRKQVCALMTSFVTAEGNVIKFLEQNKTWCGVPDQVIAASKVNHEKSEQFRTAACNENAPHPKTPTLSDVIKTPTVDSATSVKTGHGGTFDTLTGNPLAR